PPVDGDGNGGPGDRDRAWPIHDEARPGQRALERSGPGRIAHEAVGQDERFSIDRSRRRNAVAELASAAEVLDSRLRPRVEARGAGAGRGHGIPGWEARAAPRPTTSPNSARSMTRIAPRSPGRSRIGSGAPGS